ncbi:MAG: hypothetical protein J6C91_10795, partial [Muribaculaceae bacterium]|nr:hypothetical protein [Muribaculaceae bacterium]
MQQTNHQLTERQQQAIEAALDKPCFRTVSRAADELGRESYVVGGYVRDIFLHRPSQDIDFVAVGSGIELAVNVAKVYAKEHGRKPH